VVNFSKFVLGFGCENIGFFIYLSVFLFYLSVFFMDTFIGICVMSNLTSNVQGVLPCTVS
jgi:hypothetical protein